MPGLGTKRVKILYDDLKIQDLTQLEAAAKSGKMQELKGFGEKIVAGFLKAIETRQVEGRRFRRASITPYAEALLRHLRATPGVKQASTDNNVVQPQATTPGQPPPTPLGGPPQEALDVCDAVPQGGACSFVEKEGRAVVGKCNHIPPDDLVCIPPGAQPPAP